MQASPTPDPAPLSWDWSLMPGNGMVNLTYGPYSNSIRVGSLGGCVGQTVHELGDDAVAVYGALKAVPGMVAKSVNAAAIEALMGEYAAGEIGAAAFLVGIATLLDAASLAAILIAGGVAGLTVYSILDTVYCMVKGGDASAFVSAPPATFRWA